MSETIEQKKSGPYDPPREKVLLAFADALDAWSDVEANLSIWLGLVTKIPNPNVVDAIFRSVIGLRNQIDMIEAAAAVTLQPDTAEKFKTLMNRVRKAGTKRNSLVHGVWRSIHYMNGKQLTRLEMFREHSREPFGAKPTSRKEDAALRGNTRFYLGDIEAAAEHFRQVARDLMFFQETGLPEILPRL